MWQNILNNFRKAVGISEQVISPMSLKGLRALHRSFKQA
jgi:hypothetical protein